MASSFRIVGLVVLAVIGTVRGEDSDFEASPRTPGVEFRTRAWIGNDDEQFEGPFGAATKALLQAGLPDPKGLPYHEVWLPAGNCYSGDSGVVKTAGWLLEKDGEDALQFVIGWNGLVHAAIRTGAARDLAAEVDGLLKRGDLNLFGPFGWEESEDVELLPEAVDLLHGIYLTRLGFVDAAEDLLKRRERPPTEMTGPAASEWAWNLYDRAIFAHMRGDSRLVIVSLEELQRLRPEIEKICDDNGPKRWADQLDELLGDNRGRLQQGAERFDLQGLITGEPSAEELIAALNEVSVMQPGQPADVPLNESPIVEALVAEGEAAIEPLFAVLESDRRLTRSMHFWRGFARSRTVLRVQEAALFAVEELLNVSAFQLGSTGDSFSARDAAQRKEIVAALRKSWERYDKRLGPERWFATLRDDEAGSEEWIRAAAELVPHEQWDEDAQEWVVPEGRMPGDVLRSKKDPSVSDLLERRVRELGAVKGDEENESEGGRRALMTILLEWDPIRGQEVINAYCREVARIDNRERKGNVGQLLEFIGVVGKRCPEALALLNVIIRDNDPSHFESGGFDNPVLEVLAQLRSTEEVQKLERWMFTAEASPWHLRNLKTDDFDDLIRNLERGGLLEEPFYEEVILNGLADQTACGFAEIKKDAPATIEVHWEGSDGIGHLELKEQPEVTLKAGERMDLRRCDALAKGLGSWWLWQNREEFWKENKLEFNPLWPVEKRDAELRKWEDRVRRWKEIWDGE